MRLVYNWLRELVPVSVDVETAAREISLRGFEVAAVEHGREPVIDFEITANRPDCLSHLGLAREASAIWGIQIRPGSVDRDSRSGSTEVPSAVRIPDPALRPAQGVPSLPRDGSRIPDLDVVVEAPDLCPRYCAQVFEVTIGNSPDWLRARLEAAGVRPINNVVDVTNYVMDIDWPSLEAMIVQAADAISAARPGARRDILESYVKRLEKLEGIADSFEGVSKSFALQAGREIRIVVESERISDEETVWLSKDIARRIENELEYPGQIKVTVIRETRAVEFAR